LITDLPLTVRYALAASVCLAANYGQARLSGKKIAERTGIPAAFLAKILREMGRAKLIAGERGHHGGYQLTRPPTDILLADVLDAVGGPGEPRSRVCAMGDRDCGGDHPCPLHDLWSVATAPMTRLAETVTLDRLVRLSRKQQDD